MIINASIIEFVTSSKTVTVISKLTLDVPDIFVPALAGSRLSIAYFIWTRMDPSRAALIVSITLVDFAQSFTLVQLQGYNGSSAVALSAQLFNYVTVTPGTIGGPALGTITDANGNVGFVLTAAGTYLLFGTLTFLCVQGAGSSTSFTQLQTWRLNNTPAALNAFTSQARQLSIATFTQDMIVPIYPILYTTANANDFIGWKAGNTQMAQNNTKADLVCFTALKIG